jgi:hypothetical protein
LVKATSAWFSDKTALLAGWLFALYPESLLLGSSQMREAIVIPATAIAFYGLTEIQSKRKPGWLWLVGSALIIFPIQPLAGFVSFAILLGIWILDPGTMQASRKRQTILVIFLLPYCSSSCCWSTPSPACRHCREEIIDRLRLVPSINFQVVTERSSGMVQSLLDSLGEQWRWLIVLVYGIAQPVLPAIVGDPSAAWIMRIIGFLRAAGWYTLALFLVYGTLGAFHSREVARRLQLIWIGVISWA